MGSNGSIIEIAKRLFTFVGSSLAAITAVFYAVGFLVERCRWFYLGQTTIDVNSQQYLVAGGQFFMTLLPSLLDGIVALGKRDMCSEGDSVPQEDPCVRSSPVHIVIMLLVFGVLALGGSRQGRLRNLLATAAGCPLLWMYTYFLALAPTPFIGAQESDACHLSVGTRDLLIRSGAFAPPDSCVLDRNYQALLWEYVLSVFAAIVFYRVMQNCGMLTNALVKRVIWSSAMIWKWIHGSLLVVVGLYLIVLTLLLPFNFAQTMIHKSFAVVEIGSLEKPPELQPPATTFLLREDAGRYLFFIRTPRGESLGYLWLADKHDVSDVRIMENRSLWE